MTTTKTDKELLDELDDILAGEGAVAAGPRKTSTGVASIEENYRYG